MKFNPQQRCRKCGKSLQEHERVRKFCPIPKDQRKAAWGDGYSTRQTYTR